MMSHDDLVSSIADRLRLQGRYDAVTTHRLYYASGICRGEVDVLATQCSLARQSLLLFEMKTMRSHATRQHARQQLWRAREALGSRYDRVAGFCDGLAWRLLD
jgi:hypothetical protein